MDAAHPGMRALHLLQELDQTLPIDPLDVEDLGPAGLQIDCAVDVQPVPRPVVCSTATATPLGAQHMTGLT